MGIKKKVREGWELLCTVLKCDVLISWRCQRNRIKNWFENFKAFHISLTWDRTWRWLWRRRKACLAVCPLCNRSSRNLRTAGPASLQFYCSREKSGLNKAPCVIVRIKSVPNYRTGQILKIPELKITEEINIFKLIRYHGVKSLPLPLSHHNHCDLIMYVHKVPCCTLALKTKSTDPCFIHISLRYRFWSLYKFVCCIAGAVSFRLSDHITNRNLKILAAISHPSLWMISSQVVRAFDCQCRSRNSPGFAIPASSNTVEFEGQQK